MQVASGANSRPFRPSLLSHMTHLRPLIPTAHHGTGRGINSTAGAKTEFDGPSREYGTESMVYQRHSPWKLGSTAEWARWKPGREVTWMAHPVGLDQVSDQSQFNLFMEYACNGIADVTLYFQFRMNCS